jgi:lipid-binding SYLF domain-containing protein
MTRANLILGVSSMLLLALIATPLQAGHREEATVDAAVDAIQVASPGAHKGIPPALLREAAGVAVFPHVIKGGLVLDGRFGRGVLLVRQPGGAWSHPIFVTLSGGGVGLQAGLESAEVILVFRTTHAMERVLGGRGKLTLGADIAVAVGPVGVEAEASAKLRQVELYSYTHDHGLFAGVSLEGDKVQVDGEANEGFYGKKCRRAADVLAVREVKAPCVERLKEHLGKLEAPPPPPARPVPEWPPVRPR